jgi:methionyl-tRNA formyltransferase
MLEFGMLLVNNNRSKSYLQNLIREGFIPENVLILQDKSKKLPEQHNLDNVYIENFTQISIKKIQGFNFYFDEKKHIISTLKENKIPYTIVNSLDVNSSEVMEILKMFNSKYIIYSGPGGCILRNNILSIDKKFIHAHPGWLPEYKGSTTIYYSMLIENNIGCSVILLEEKIDSGPILFQQIFNIPRLNIVDFDLTVDPLIRTITLINFMKKQKEILSNKKYKQNKGGNTFYIIHPILKHLSILKYIKNQNVK